MMKQENGMSATVPPHGEENPWPSGYINDTYDFASQCAAHRDSNPYEEPALDAIMNCLATELWDRFFSVSEIRNAFEKAIESLPSYAAGEERRGDKY
jgi:hypothetical protein